MHRVPLVVTYVATRLDPFDSVGIVEVELVSESEMPSWQSLLSSGALEAGMNTIPCFSGTEYIGENSHIDLPVDVEPLGSLVAGVFVEEFIHCPRSDPPGAVLLDVDTLTVMTAVPLPGSPLYERSLALGALSPDTPFSAFTTRNALLTTSEFDPQWVDRLARRTMIRHALKHPSAYIYRAYEKFRSAPASTLQAVARNVMASIGTGG